MNLKKTRTGNTLHYLTEWKNTGTEVQDREDEKVVTSRGSLVPLLHCKMTEKFYGCGSMSALNFVCVCIFLLTYACV